MSEPTTSWPGWAPINVWTFIARLGLCSSLLGLFALPFSSSLAAAALTALLALPFALVATSAVAVLAGSPLVALGQRRGFARGVLIAAAGGLVFAPGAYLANVGLVDDPLQTPTLVACGLAGVVGLLVMAIAHWALRRSRLESTLASLPAARVLGPLSVGLGFGLVVLDASFLSEGYLSFHLLLLGLIVTCLATFAAVVVRDASGRRVASLTTLVILGAAVLLTALGPTQTTYVQVANSATLDRRLLLLARRALDRDGDGFAAALGGGDCDDHDVNAYPLSSKGRDCLQWVGRDAPVVSRALPSATPAAAEVGPRVILLVSVDTLRCEAGAPTFAGLPELCPELKQLAREGRERAPAYTTYPSTAFATLSLHEGTFYPQPGSKRGLLAASMKAHGRTTHAVSTHSKQMPPRIAQSFDSVDRTLQAQATRGSASTSVQVTQRTLDWLRGNRARPVFVWAHYYDPHSPYVDPPGSHSALTPATTRYAAEVRRTEREVARLVRAAAALEPSTFALITADHGEEFGEHGNMYHGTTLYEAGVRVPMIAWGANVQSGAERIDLPISIAEVAPFLISVVRDEAFASGNEAFFWVASQGKRLVGVYRDSHKLSYDEGLNVTALYNVASDPAEANNLVHARPALREKLGAKLAAYLQPPTVAESP